jgi:hypothetical protein
MEGLRVDCESEIETIPIEPDQILHMGCLGQVE